MWHAGSSRPSACRCRVSGNGRHRWLRRRFCGFFGGCYRGDFRFGDALQLAANFFGDLHRNGTGMRFFLGNAKAGQKIDDGLSLDLEFTGQFVDADLGCVTHASLRTFLFLLALGEFLFRGFSRRVILRGGFVRCLLGCGIAQFLLVRRGLGFFSTCCGILFG